MRSIERPTTLEEMSPCVIDDISSVVDIVEIPLRNPFETGFGTITSRPSVVVNLAASVNGKSCSTLSEGATLDQPLFTEDSAVNIVGNVEHIITTIKNEVALRKDEGSTATIRELIEVTRTAFDEDGERYPTARFAVEVALLGLYMQGESVYDQLEIPRSITSIPYGKSIGGGTTKELIASGEKALERGSKRLKYKISPALFTTVMGALSSISGAEMIMVDANGSFDPENSDHLTMLGELDTMGLTMIEEPVSRVGNTRGLRAIEKLRNKLNSLKTPICLDDCLTTVFDCELAMVQGWADILNLKPGRLGSFIECLRLARLARQNSSQVMVGGMFEASFGRCVTLALGAYCVKLGFGIPGDLSLPQETLMNDLMPTGSAELQLNEAGEIILPRNRGGWGYNV